MIAGIVLVDVHILVITVTVERVAGFMMEIIRSETTATAMAQALVCFFHPLCVWATSTQT